MQDTLRSRAYEIKDPAHAAVFSEPIKREILLLCGAEARSVQDLSHHLDTPLRKVHYHATRLVALELLHVAHEKPRNGRAIKYYQACAKSFFVPNHLMTDPSQKLRAALVTALEDARMKSDGGTLLFTGDDGIMRIKKVEGDAKLSQAFEGWARVRLSDEDFKDIKDAFTAVLHRAIEKRTESGGRVFDLHFAGVKRLE